MLSALKRIFDDSVRHAATDGGDRAEHAQQRAVAALLSEMSRADRDATHSERALIGQALQDVFGLASDEVEELLQAGASDAEAAISLYEFTSVLNREFDHAQKVHFVELLWQIAYSDGELEKHEAHLVRKVADLLHLRHREYIGGKLKAERS